MSKTLLEYEIMRKTAPRVHNRCCVCITMRIALPLFRDCSASYGYYANSKVFSRVNCPFNVRNRPNAVESLCTGDAR